MTGQQTEPFGFAGASVSAHNRAPELPFPLRLLRWPIACGVGTEPRPAEEERPAGGLPGGARPTRACSPFERMQRRLNLHLRLHLRRLCVCGRAYSRMHLRQAGPFVIGRRLWPRRPLRAPVRPNYPLPASSAAGASSASPLRGRGRASGLWGASLVASAPCWVGGRAGGRASWRRPDAAYLASLLCAIVRRLSGATISPAAR